MWMLTYSISFTEMTCNNIVHIVILTQVQLQQIDLHFTVLDKHAMFNDLETKRDILEAQFTLSGTWLK